MKSTLGLAAILAPALFISAALQCDLTVHEWGTFTSVAGEHGSAVPWDVLGCKSDLPRFVNDVGSRGFKSSLSGTVRMETPVLYFYSPQELDAHVKVGFPQGIITEWYPKADLNGTDIEWKNIKVQPDAKPVLPVESEPSRYYAARGTDAAPVTVEGQQEKFLFYRGVGFFKVLISARSTASGKIVVENRNQDAVPSVILFENRQGRIGYRAAGAMNASLSLDPPTLNGSLPQLRQDLETTLIAQGLFPKEAQAMVATWQDSWFEEGSRLIYIVPPAAVDAILPLQVTPTPSQTVRVFVGRIELITPATMQSVESAVAKGDWSAVARYRRFLDPILQRLYPGDATRVREIEQRFAAAGSAGGCAAQAPRQPTSAFSSR
jgi:hypothetical protein